MIDNSITCEGMPTAEEMEEGNRRARELVALWMWNDNFEENALLVAKDRELAAPIAESGWMRVALCLSMSADKV